MPVSQSPSFTMARLLSFSGWMEHDGTMEPDQVRESLVAGAIVGRDGPMLQVLPVDALTRPPWQAGKSMEIPMKDGIFNGNFACINV